MQQCQCRLQVKLFLQFNRYVEINNCYKNIKIVVGSLHFVMLCSFMKLDKCLLGIGSDSENCIAPMVTRNRLFIDR